ncbi:MAG: amino acid adenylation domain-containing protein [Nitrospira sp.]|nr:amino acid adenylation domain-containing protein [Nitrospira sp.]
MSSQIESAKNIDHIYPLSPMQEGLLFHTLLNPGSGVYLMQDRYSLTGELDHAAFRQAWQRVIDRHDILRTSFVWENQKRPLQVVHKRMDVPLVELDWRKLSAIQQQQELDNLLQQELQAGFDFSRAPLLRLRLIRLTDSSYQIIRSYHLILMDAWCLSLLMVDFFTFYKALVQGQERSLEKPRAYKDYIAWLQKQDPLEAERFWRKILHGRTTPTPLGVVHRNLKDESSVAAMADQILHLSAETTGTLLTLSKEHQITLNTFLQGAWALLMSGYSGESDVLFGVTVAGRPVDLEGVESIVGLFINSLPLRVQIPKDSRLMEWLQSLLAQNLCMRQYEYASLVQIQGWSEVPRGQPLFESLLVYENVPVDPFLTHHGLPFRAQQERNRTHTNYPLTVVIMLGEQLGLQLTYDQRQFDDAIIIRMLEQFQYLLEQMAQRPHCRLGDLTPLLPRERHQLTVNWNATTATYPAEASVAELFEAQMKRTPKAIAVRCGAESVTYAELDRRAEQVAYALVDDGVGPETIVAVLVERSLDLMVLMLGIFKAGAAYLPLDPHHPAGRWQQILTQGQVPWLLTTEAFQHHMIGAMEFEARENQLRIRTLESFVTTLGDMSRSPRRTHPSQLAYVIYTSGSTGIPKGAMVTQQGMINNVWGKVPLLGLTATDVVAQTASHCFDISVWQLLSALLCGGRVEILTEDIVRDPPRLLAELARTGVTVAELVPSLLREVLAVEPSMTLPTLRWLLPTGEAILPELCRTWFAQYPAVPLLNAYGPAECADDVAYYALTSPPGTEETVVPIGRPAANLRLYILSPDLQMMPIGVTGEICIGGVGVGRGYLEDPARTAGAFVPHPFAATPGERLYRTGDLGRYREDGTLEFLGRRDQQVKVRGYRIELGEVEAVLAAQPGVQEQVVIVREERPGQAQLVAYVVVHGEETTGAALRQALRDRLPDYMVPSVFVLLDALPLTPNGKIDQKALPSPEGVTQSDDRYEAPQTPTEELLAGIWTELLGVSRVGRHDNFFDLGGHSLLAVQLLSRLRKVFRVELTLRDLFMAPTVVQIADRIEEYLIKQLEGLSDSETEDMLIGRS